jgi:hypothetical protein
MTKYKLVLSKTSDGRQDYLQIISQDQFSTNIVLIGKFDVKDIRSSANAGYAKECNQQTNKQQPKI